MAQQSTGPNHPLNQQSSIGRGDSATMLAGNRRRDRRLRQRRGVLLLVCLVLLVMFLMLGVTFVLTAGNFRRSSEAYQRMLERPSADLPERSGDLLDSVAHDLVRGTANGDSPFSEENLLEDLYGRPALRGVVNSAVHAGGGSISQLTELTITEDGDFTPLPGTHDYYAGQVLTFLTGNAKGRSTRIVGWDGSSKLTIVSLPDAAELSGPEDLNKSHFLVNGRPFSGDGSDRSGRQLNEDYDKADANNPWLTSKAAADGSVTAAYSDQSVNGSTNPEVDNDGDGEKDSVWIDVGLPLQLQPDGTYVKPLVAMMVRDLDGRVNLNAHGSMYQVRGSIAADKLGLGYGPAEIDPKHIFFEQAPHTQEHVGKLENFVCRRRSAELSLTPPASGDGDSLPVGDGYLGDGSYDAENYDISHASNAIDATKQDALNDFLQFGSAPQDLITPIDPHGLTPVDDSLLNADGSVNLQSPFNDGDDFFENPYEKQLDTANDIVHSHDPYTPEQLEGVLRFADADEDAIDPRLAHDLAPLGITGPEQLKMIRDLITTESWDLPVAGLAWPKGLSGRLTDTPTPGHITDLFAARFIKEGTAPNDAAAQGLAADLVAKTGGVNRQLIAPGLLRGTRMNVNRLLGNGWDDDGNDVVDDVGEVVAEKVYGLVEGDLGYNENLYQLLGGVDFNHDGVGAPGQPNDKRARQHYAQQLYLLLMLLADGLESDPAIGGQENLARRLAQFAVNAVDYRDADSIMTGFEYDAFPFDATGWDVDGDLLTDEGNDGIDNNDNDDIDNKDTDGDGTNEDVDTLTGRGREARYVVWGYEKPVAALTGTMALHDLRIKDTDAGSGKTTETQETSPLPPNIPVVDSNYDQYAPPEGALFLQIYALEQHGIDNAAKFPRELYNASGSLELSSTLGGSPVWRVAISEPHAKDGTAASTTTAGANGPLINQLIDSDDTQDVGDEARRQWNKTKSLVPNHTGVPKNLPSGQTEQSVEFENKKKVRFDGGGSGDIVLERVIYFVDQGQITTDLDFDPLNNPSLASQTSSSSKPSNGATYCASPGSSVSLTPGQTTVVGSGSFRSNGARQSLGNVTCKRKVSNGYGGTSGYGRTNINLSVSEPVALATWDFVPDKTPHQWQPSDWTTYFTNNPYYKDNAVPVAGGDEILPAPVDEPFDLQNNSPISALSNYANFKRVSGPVQITGVATDPNADPPAALETVYREEFKGTVGHYCTAFLQRLADPTRPYNQLDNPYVTVDLMPIDLTVYSSDGDGDQAVFASDANINSEPLESDPTQFTPPLKTDTSTGAGEISQNPPSGSFESLGWRERTQLIDPSGSLTSSPTPPTAPAPTGFVTQSAPLPFWPNRPFVSQYELLMVPASEPGKLMLELGSHTGTPKSTFAAGFPHLLNFFFQSSSQPQLGRVFEYLHVPSKYAGTQISLSPGNMSGVDGFAPPFNVISTYREPGRVNLNTIEDPKIWNAVMHGAPTVSSSAHFGPAFDTLSEKTLYGAGDVQGASDGLSMPLLQSEDSGVNFENTGETDNPFLRYQPINRMGNLVTNRSNVYAVWMTLGFFETNKSGALVNPSVEAGGSQAERHRAFYIIDRSIPVGYENGHDHNTEDVFRVKRYIE